MAVQSAPLLPLCGARVLGAPGPRPPCTARLPGRGRACSGGGRSMPCSCPPGPPPPPSLSRRPVEACPRDGTRSAQGSPGVQAGKMRMGHPAIVAASTHGALIQGLCPACPCATLLSSASAAIARKSCLWPQSPAPWPSHTWTAPGLPSAPPSCRTATL